MSDAEPTSCSQHLSIRAETAVENTGLMRWDLNIAYQCWVAPDAKRIVWEAAGGDDLTVVGAPSQAGDLRAGVNAVYTSTGGGVPEMDVTVV